MFMKNNEEILLALQETGLGLQRFIFSNQHRLARLLAHARVLGGGSFLMEEIR